MVCEVFEQCRKNPQNQYQNCKNCRQINSNSVVVCSEKKSRYALQNPNHVSITIFHVDGGVVRDEECCRKCDYIYDISMPLKSIAIFIELKGKHLVDALEQIENSVKLFMPTFKKTIILGRIICSSVPNIVNDPKSVQLGKKLKALKVDMKIGEKNMEESLVSLSSN